MYGLDKIPRGKRLNDQNKIFQETKEWDDYIDVEDMVGNEVVKTMCSNTKRKVPEELASMVGNFRSVDTVKRINQREFEIEYSFKLGFEAITYLFSHRYSITYIGHLGNKTWVTVTPHEFIEEMIEEEIE